MNDFRYFRHSAAACNDDLEIFSDPASRMDMLRRIVKKRMLPVCILMLLAIALMLPGAARGDMPAVLDIIRDVVRFCRCVSLCAACTAFTGCSANMPMKAGRHGNKVLLDRSAQTRYPKRTGTMNRKSTSHARSAERAVSG